MSLFCASFQFPFQLRGKVFAEFIVVKENKEQIVKREIITGINAEKDVNGIKFRSNEICSWKGFAAILFFLMEVL